MINVPIPPGLVLAAAEPGGVMTDLVIILATAGAVTLVLRRLKMATIPAYLIAGAIIGPYALKLVADSGSIETISHIAVILLMFGLGMHMDPAELKGRFAPILAIGSGAWIVVAAVIAAVLVAAGMHWAMALIVGMALSMSSTAAVLRLLQQRRELEQVHGRLSFGILIVQDLIVVAVLALVPLLAEEMRGGGGAEQAPIDWTALLGKGLTSLGAIGLLIVVGRIVLPRVLEVAAGGGEADLLLVIAGAAALGAAALTSWLGFSAELGAFIAGLLLSATPLRFQISGQLAPMRDLFMAVFFVAVGLNLNVEDALAGWWIVLLGTAGLLVLKSVTIGSLAWAAGASAPLAALAGLALAQGGEFTLVILNATTAEGVEFDGASLLVSIVVLSLVVTPWLIQLGHILAARLAAAPVAPWIRASALRDTGVACATDHAGHVIIAGFGPVGRTVAEHLEAAGRPYTVVEMNAATVKRQAALGRSVVYGDASNPDVLRSAGVEGASAVILTIPDDAAMLRAVRAIRTLAPDAFIAARANFVSKAMQAKQLGASYVVSEEVATAEAMAQQVAMALGEGLMETKGQVERAQRAEAKRGKAAE